MQDIKELLTNPFVQNSIITLWHFLLIVLATIGATQFAKIVARLTTSTKFDGLLVQATALIMAMIFANYAWSDDSGWLVGGFSAYVLSSVLARYGILYLKSKFPKAAKMINRT